MHRSLLAALVAASGVVIGRRRVPSTGETTDDGETITVAIKPAGGYRSPPPHRSSSGTPVKAWRASGPVLPQGGKAAARRRRQIERGQLKAENGLAREAR